MEGAFVSSGSLNTLAHTAGNGVVPTVKVLPSKPSWRLSKREMQSMRKSDLKHLQDDIESMIEQLDDDLAATDDPVVIKSIDVQRDRHGISY